MSHHSDSRRPLVCYHCKQPGHHIRDCTSRSQAQPQHSSHNAASSASQPPDTQQKLKKLCIAIGEQSLNTVERNLTLLSNALIAELPTHRSFILSTLLHCVKALPAKHNIFAAVTALVTLSSPGFAADALSLLSTALLHALSMGQHDEGRLLVRFLACLSHVRVVESASVYAVLAQVAAWVDGATESVFRDYYLHSLVSLLPWIGVEEAGSELFNGLVTEVAGLMDKRPPPTPLVRVFQSDDSEDLLAAYWAAVHAAHVRGGEVAWRTELIMRPHVKHATAFAALEPLPFAIDLPLPPSSVPPPALPPLLHLFPEHPLSPSLSPSSLSHYVAHTLLMDVLTIFEAIHREATKQLLLLPTGDDYSAILVSLLFSSLFTLPCPPTRPVYYAAIIIDLFKAEPVVMPPIIGLAINNLFERLDSLNLEAFDRLVRWFAFHLSNFSFVWPWANWSAVLETDEYTAQRVFVQDMFERMVRLSFWERIQQTIPEELIVLMPHQPAPAFRFGGATPAAGAAETRDGAMEEEKEAKQSEEGGEGGLNAVAKAVMDKVREKISNEDLIAYLTSALASSSSLSSPLQLLIPCLLHAGHKSYSHVFALLERYSAAVAHFASQSPASALQLVTAVAEFWQHSHQHVLVLLDRVLDKGWVQPAVVISWALTGKVDDMQAAFVWEVVAMVMDSVVERRTRARDGMDMAEAAEGQSAGAVKALLTAVSRVLRVSGKSRGWRRTSRAAREG